MCNVTQLIGGKARIWIQSGSRVHILISCVKNNKPGLVGKIIIIWFFFFPKNIHAYPPVPNVCLFVFCFERASQMIWTFISHWESQIRSSQQPSNLMFWSSSTHCYLAGLGQDCFTQTGEGWAWEWRHCDQHSWVKEASVSIAWRGWGKQGWTDFLMRM